MYIEYCSQWTFCALAIGLARLSPSGRTGPGIQVQPTQDGSEYRVPMRGFPPGVDLEKGHARVALRNATLQPFTGPFGFRETGPCQRKDEQGDVSLVEASGEFVEQGPGLFVPADSGERADRPCGRLGGSARKLRPLARMKQGLLEILPLEVTVGQVYVREPEALIEVVCTQQGSLRFVRVEYLRAPAATLGFLPITLVP